MFKVCPVCDFEWHIKDGPNCPTCDNSNQAGFEKETDQYRGGAFGTGEHSARFKNWYAAIGIIALVLIIYSFILT